MAATLTLRASRKILSSVCLLSKPLAFHCSMLNVLSDMVGVWVGLCGGEGARVAVVVVRLSVHVQFNMGLSPRDS